MKYQFLLVFLFTFSANAEDPSEKFLLDKIMSNQIKVTVSTSDNINKTCDTEAKRRGFKPYGFSVEACSFWSSDFKACDIYLPKTVNLHTIGHEFRHCLQGNYH